MEVFDAPGKVTVRYDAVARCLVSRWQILLGDHVRAAVEAGLAHTATTPCCSWVVDCTVARAMCSRADLEWLRLHALPRVEERGVRALLLVGEPTFAPPALGGGEALGGLSVERHPTLDAALDRAQALAGAAPAGVRLLTGPLGRDAGI